MAENNRDLTELEKKYDEAGECGRAFQKMGQKLVSASEQGKDIINDIKQDDKVLKNPEVQSWLAAANATVPNFSWKDIKPIESYYFAVSTSTASAAAIVPYYIHNHKKEYELSEADSNELDEYLKKFSIKFTGIPELRAMRKGAWDTFYSATDVNLMNASHSMREILRHIISQIATNEEVKKSEWWAKPPDTEKEVTGKQRFQYLIFGPLNDKPAEIVEMTIKTCFSAYIRLQEVAHGSRGLREDVKRFMQITEHALLTMLRYVKWKNTSW